MMMMMCVNLLIQFNKFIYVRQQTAVNVGLPFCIDNLMCLPSTEDMLENHQFARQWHCGNKSIKIFFQRQNQKTNKQKKAGLDRMGQPLEITVFKMNTPQHTLYSQWREKLT